MMLTRRPSSFDSSARARESIFEMALTSVRQSREDPRVAGTMSGSHQDGFTADVVDALLVWQSLPDDAEPAAERFVMARFDATHEALVQAAVAARSSLAAAEGRAADRLDELKVRAHAEEDEASVVRVLELQDGFKAEHRRLQGAVSYAEEEVLKARRLVSAANRRRRISLVLSRIGVAALALSTEFLPLPQGSFSKVTAALALYVLLDWLLVSRLLEPSLRSWNRRRTASDLGPALARMDKAASIARHAQQLAVRPPT